MCVTKLYVEVREEEAEEEVHAGCKSKKQEPHTILWGTTATNQTKKTVETIAFLFFTVMSSSMFLLIKIGGGYL